MIHVVQIQIKGIVNGDGIGWEVNLFIFVVQIIPVRVLSITNFPTNSSWIITFHMKFVKYRSLNLTFLSNLTFRGALVHTAFWHNRMSMWRRAPEECETR